MHVHNNYSKYEYYRYKDQNPKNVTTNYKHFVRSDGTKSSTYSNSK
jgi:hypothetical protein